MEERKRERKRMDWETEGEWGRRAGEIMKGEWKKGKGGEGGESERERKRERQRERGRRE